MKTINFFFARCIMLIHFCVVFLFFSSPFFPLYVKYIFIIAGILTIPLRKYVFQGQCPLTQLERNFRIKAGDITANIHNKTFMEAYFRIPDAIYSRIESVLIIILLCTMATEIFYK